MIKHFNQASLQRLSLKKGQSFLACAKIKKYEEEFIMSSLKPIDAFGTDSGDFVSEEPKTQKGKGKKERDPWHSEVVQENDLDEDTWNRLYQAWLKAYETKQLIVETVTADRSFVGSCTQHEIRDREGLHDIILKNTFQKRINAKRIPFLSNIFRAPAEICLTSNVQQIDFEFDGSKEDFIKDTHILIKSIDEILHLVDRVA